MFIRSSRVISVINAAALLLVGSARNAMGFSSHTILDISPLVLRAAK